MKILIFASARSGSTELTHALSKLLKLKSSLEPFNPLNIKGLTEEQINTIGNNIPDNTITKVLSMHRTRKWYLSYINKFDKVIYLTRDNTKLATESFYWAMHRKEVENANYPVSSKWHMSYSFNSSKVNISKWIAKHITNSTEEVKSVAYLNNNSYIVYEDLYSNDITEYNKAVDYIGLDLDRIQLRDILHPSKKYRKEFKPKTII